MGRLNRPVRIDELLARYLEAMLLAKLAELDEEIFNEI